MGRPRGRAGTGCEKRERKSESISGCKVESQIKSHKAVVETGVGAVT